MAASVFALLAWGTIEAYGNFRASVLVESLRTATISDVPAIVGRISSYRRWADSRLKVLSQSTDHTSREELNARLGLLPVDRSQLQFLQKRLLDASPSELPVLRDAMGHYRAELIPKLWNGLEAAKAGDVGMLSAAGALAMYDPTSTNWQTAARGGYGAVTVNPIYLGSWLDALRPVHGHLIFPLAVIFRDKERPDREHALATNILAEYGGDDPELLAEQLAIADPIAYKEFFAVAQYRPREKVLMLFQAELAKKVPASGNDR